MKQKRVFPCNMLYWCISCLLIMAFVAVFTPPLAIQAIQNDYLFDFFNVSNVISRKESLGILSAIDEESRVIHQNAADGSIEVISTDSVFFIIYEVGDVLVKVTQTVSNLSSYDILNSDVTMLNISTAARSDIYNCSFEKSCFTDALIFDEIEKELYIGVSQIDSKPAVVRLAYSPSDNSTNTNTNTTTREMQVTGFEMLDGNKFVSGRSFLCLDNSPQTRERTQSKGLIHFFGMGTVGYVEIATLRLSTLQFYMYNTYFIDDIVDPMIFFSSEPHLDTYTERAWTTVTRTFQNGTEKSYLLILNLALLRIGGVHDSTSNANSNTSLRAYTLIESPPILSGSINEPAGALRFGLGTFDFEHRYGYWVGEIINNNSNGNLKNVILKYSLDSLAMESVLDFEGLISSTPFPHNLLSSAIHFQTQLLFYQADYTHEVLVIDLKEFGPYSDVLPSLDMMELESRAQSESMGLIVNQRGAVAYFVVTYPTEDQLSSSIATSPRQLLRLNFKDTVCPAGTNISVIPLNCSPCSPGFGVSKLEWGRRCVGCGLGYYSENNECKECEAGTFAVGPNNAVCTVCPEGTFGNQTGLSICLDCEKGTFANETGLSVCESCAEGYFAPFERSINCSPCPSGTYSKGIGNADCLDCEPGYWSSSGAGSNCTPCSVGMKSEFSKSALCDPCPPGEFQNLTGQSFCFKCPSGTFTFPNYGNYECIECPIGTFGPLEGASSIGNCIECSGFTTTASEGSKTISDCNVCISNKVFSKDGNACVCSEGFYLDIDTNDCLPCANRYFKNEKGDHLCSECPSYAQSVDGLTCECLPSFQTRIEPLSNNSNTNNNNSSLIVCECPAGLTVNSDIINNNNMNDEIIGCSPCNDGSYKSKEGNHECKPCIANALSSDSYRNCQCANGYYRITFEEEGVQQAISNNSNSNNLKNECALCPHLGAECYNERMIIKEGWWISLPNYIYAYHNENTSNTLLVSRATSDLQISFHIIQCHTKEACKGGVPNSSIPNSLCSEGYEGIACSTCSPQYALNSLNECIYCDSYGENNDNNNTQTLKLILLIICISSIPLMYFIHRASTPKTLIRFHILMNFIQLYAQISFSSSNLSSSSSFASKAIRWLLVFEFDIFSFFRLRDCIFQFNFSSLWFLKLTVPLWMIVLLVFLFLLLKVINRTVYWYNDRNNNDKKNDNNERGCNYDKDEDMDREEKGNEDEENSEDKNHNINSDTNKDIHSNNDKYSINIFVTAEDKLGVQNFFNCCFSVFSLLYLLQTKTAMSVFSCESIENRSYLSINRSVECFEGIHIPMIICASLSLLLFSITYPLVLLFFSLKLSDKNGNLGVNNENNNNNCIGHMPKDGRKKGKFLNGYINVSHITYSYKEYCKWWDFKHYLRKFIAMFFLIIFINKPEAQGFTLSLMLVLFWLLHLKYRPYENNFDNFLEHAAYFALYIAFSLIVLREGGDSYASGESYASFVTVVSCVVGYGVGIALFCCFLYDIVKKKYALLLSWCSCCRCCYCLRQQRAEKGNKKEDFNLMKGNYDNNSNNNNNNNKSSNIEMDMDLQEDGDDERKNGDNSDNEIEMADF